MHNSRWTCHQSVCPAALKLCSLTTQCYPLQSLDQNFVFFSYHQTHCMSSSSFQRVFIFSKLYDNQLSANSKIISLIPWKYIGHYIYITWLNSESSYCQSNTFILFYVYQNKQVLFLYTESTRVFYNGEAVHFLLGRDWFFKFHVVNITSKFLYSWTPWLVSVLLALCPYLLFPDVPFKFTFLLQNI